MVRNNRIYNKEISEFVSEINQSQAVLKTTVLLSFILYLFPLTLSSFFNPYPIALLYVQALLFALILSYFGIYLIPRKLIYFTLNCEKLRIDLGLNWEIYSIRSKGRFEAFLVSLVSLTIFVIKKFVLFLTIEPVFFDVIVEVIILVVFGYAVIFTLIPIQIFYEGGFNYKVVEVKYENSRLLALFTVSIIIVGSYILIVFNKDISQIAKEILSLAIVTSVYSFVSTGYISSRYFLNHRRLGMVIIITATQAILAMFASIYITMGLIKMFNFPGNTLISLLTMVKRLLTTIISIILMYLYIEKKITYVLWERTRSLEVERERIELLYEFIRDLITKVILFNLLWLPIMIMMDLLGTDITHLLIGMATSKVNGIQLISGSEVGYETVIQLSTTLYFLYLVTTINTVRITGYLRDIIINDIDNY